MRLSPLSGTLSVPRRGNRGVLGLAELLVNLFEGCIGDGRSRVKNCWLHLNPLITVRKLLACRLVRSWPANGNVAYVQSGVYYIRGVSCGNELAVIMS